MVDLRRRPRFLLVAFPVQGHINPGLHFAKRIISIGAHVTFVTALSAHRRMSTGGSTTVPGLSFAPFSDGYEDGFKPGVDREHYLSEISRCGSKHLSDLILSGAGDGQPFTGLVSTIFMPWALEVAHELQLPSALLWVQPAAVFDLFFYFFHGYGDLIKNNSNNPSCSIELPGLPLKFTGPELPSFLHASNTDILGLKIFENQFELLDKEKNPKVLVNTFDGLETEALRSIRKFNLIGIGPLNIPSDTSFGGDPFQISEDYKEWLDSKPKRSVIYVSFGSICVLSNPQMEEIGRALLDFGSPFLWVMRRKQKVQENGKEKEEEEVSCREELEKLGKIVPWCSQLDVLSNTSLGCFVTHCGWNSTLESLVCGVPMVAFPQRVEQGTNAMLVEDVWKTGLRVKANKEGIVERHEIKRCLELVMEDEEIGEKITRNAKKWKDLGREAAMEGGSSDKNLKAFLKMIQEKV
ncbi:phloretin 4'-O-glucosyltransferase [Ziziphus jujuba]|uniref:Glycosyltransferase n=1 Tax=Ziziphus jujuba TaxID=326968 RepID=A0ABM3IPV8_ZIZJJ|nr:phloretin 4'-O-glucosyltransferase [Ziziphus jujuba]